MSDTAALITAFAALITSFTLFISVVLTRRGIKQVHEEVKTGNSQTLAQLADADESRRIDTIPKKNRTKLERSHVRDVESV